MERSIAASIASYEQSEALSIQTHPATMPFEFVDSTAPIGIVGVRDEFVCLPFATQPEGLIRDHFVDREAVVQLDDVDVGGIYAAITIDAMGSRSRDIAANHAHQFV